MIACFTKAWFNLYEDKKETFKVYENKIKVDKIMIKFIKKDFIINVSLKLFMSVL